MGGQDNGNRSLMMVITLVCPCFSSVVSGQRLRLGVRKKWSLRMYKSMIDMPLSNNMV